MSATYYSQATAELRWSKEGRLQQRFTSWRVDHNGYAVGHSLDWRDVPTEGGAVGETDRTSDGVEEKEAR